MNSFTQVGRCTTEGYFGFCGGALDVPNDFGYWIANSIDTLDAYLLKIRLSTMQLVDVINVQALGLAFSPFATVYNGVLYVVQNVAVLGPDLQLHLFDLNTFTYITAINLSPLTCAGGFVADNNLMYFGGSPVLCSESGASKLGIYNLATHSFTTHGLTNISINGKMVPYNGFLYAAYQDNNSTNGVARIRLSDFGEVALLPLPTNGVSIGNIFLYKGFIYCGTWTQGNPLKFYKINPAPLGMEDSLDLPQMSTGDQFLDSRWGFYYFTTNAADPENPDVVSRINLNTFVRDNSAGTVPPMLGGGFESGHIDINNGFAYFGGFISSQDAPDSIYKFDIKPSN